MNKVDELSKKIKKMPLEDLLRMAATALEEKMSDSHIDFILIHVDMALQKRRMLKQLGMTE